MTKTKNPLARPETENDPLPWPDQFRARPQGTHADWLKRLLLITIDQYLTTCTEMTGAEQRSALDRVLDRAEELIRRSF